MKRGQQAHPLPAPSLAQRLNKGGQLHPALQLPEQLLLRPTEVARVLGLGRSTIYELMHAGELPVIHIGRAVRIPRRAVETWIEERAAAESIQPMPLR